ncbi:MAG: YicC/YloC family endoribonuclease [Candidatus Hydrothermia bacterium]
MLKSMTGFGRSQGKVGDHIVLVSISSVNSKFLDIRLSLPDDAAEAEAEIRRLIQQRLSRGRIQVTIKMTNTGSLLPVDGAALTEYLTRLKEFVPEGIVPTVDLFNAPRVANALSGMGGEIITELSAIVSAALEEMERTRNQEGKRTGRVVLDLIERLSRLTDEAESLKEEENESRKRTILENISRLPLADEEVRQRLFLEASWMVIKSDVKEELERIRGHLSALRETLSQEGPVGKRLEFLCQELHREATTLSSKSSCPKLISLSVTMRELIEQIREQVRNLE